MLGLLLFAVVLLLLLAGFPVALTLGGVSVLFGLATFGLDFFAFLPLRIWGIIGNQLLLAVPLFIFMGVMLERSGLAEALLEAMAMLFGRVRGGLALSVVAVGGLLAASTGVVGATVVTMGLLSLPTMLKRGYDPRLATGTIAAAGTLGQIIPPSIVLILLGSVLNVSVGDLFVGAMLPGALLLLLYALYVGVTALLKPHAAPAMPAAEVAAFLGTGVVQRLLRALIAPAVLIVSVLGSIFAGIASPTEAAAVGAVGAMLLTANERRLTWATLRTTAFETAHLTSMVFVILVGAAAFSLTFRGLGGDHYLTQLVTHAELKPVVFLAIYLTVIFVAGFFIDFIEIIFILVPVVLPILNAMGTDLLWLGILIAINLQTSFLTPPFGFSLFYLKGVAPPEIGTRQIYAGAMPFVAIQLLGLLLVWLFPETVTCLPELLRSDAPLGELACWGR